MSCQATGHPGRWVLHWARSFPQKLSDTVCPVTMVPHRAVYVEDPGRSPHRSDLWDSSSKRQASHPPQVPGTAPQNTGPRGQGCTPISNKTAPGKRGENEAGQKLHNKKRPTNAFSVNITDPERETNEEPTKETKAKEPLEPRAAASELLEKPVGASSERGSFLPAAGRFRIEAFT